jgi:hypothetical protein
VCLFPVVSFFGVGTSNFPNSAQNEDERQKKPKTIDFTGQISKPINGREYINEDGVWVAESIGVAMKHNISVSYGGSITLGNGETKDLGPTRRKKKPLRRRKPFATNRLKPAI